MNAEKLSKMQAQVRIGGKGTARRKKKVVHRSVAVDDKKLQSSLRKLTVNGIPGVEEVNMIKDNGTVIHFNNPKVQASASSNTFAITGLGETKNLEDMLPGILSQLGRESLGYLRQMATKQAADAASQTAHDDHDGGDDDDEDEDGVPDLVENFDVPSKSEVI